MKRLSKPEFRHLFIAALGQAALKTEEKFLLSLPRTFAIGLNKFRYDGAAMSVDTALDRLYIDEERFFVFIDLAVTAVLADSTFVFCRISGHPPGPWEKTSHPKDFGPFHVLISEGLDRRQEEAVRWAVDS